MTKLCKNRNGEGCGLQKSIDSFRKNRNKCKQCELEDNKKYYEDNKEKELQRCQMYKNTHKEELKITSKKYYENNRELRIENTRKWENKNKERVKDYNKRYNAKYYENNKGIIMEKYYENIKNISENKIKAGYNSNDYIFYTLKFFHKVDGFSFYKYGITRDDIKTRFKSYNDYTYEIIDMVYGDILFIKALENKHLRESIEDIFKFPKDYNFGGKTECRNNLVKSLKIIK